MPFSVSAFIADAIVPAANNGDSVPCKVRNILSPLLFSGLCGGRQKRAGIGERYLSHFIHIKPYIVLDRTNQMQYMVFLRFLLPEITYKTMHTANGNKQYTGCVILRTECALSWQKRKISQRQYRENSEID